MVTLNFVLKSIFLEAVITEGLKNNETTKR